VMSIQKSDSKCRQLSSMIHPQAFVFEREERIKLDTSEHVDSRLLDQRNRSASSSLAKQSVSLLAQQAGSNGLGWTLHAG
jgi:hypothetical protein